MLLVNKARFLKFPAGVFYIEVDDETDPATAMITRSIKVKGNSYEDFDCHEGNLSFSPTPEDNGHEDWPCIDNVYDKEKGFSESMDLSLILTRGGLIGENDVRFIVFEDKDLKTMKAWIEKAMSSLADWIKEQGDKYPEVMQATKKTFEDEDFE